MFAMAILPLAPSAGTHSRYTKECALDLPSVKRWGWLFEAGDATPGSALMMEKNQQQYLKSPPHR